MLRTIHLHGSLAEQFGPSFKMQVNSPCEAIRALCTQLHGFERTIAEGDAFRCVVGKKISKGRSFGATRLPRTDDEHREAAKTLATDLRQPWHTGEEDFHIVPVVRGRGRGGVAKIVVGVVLIAAAVMTSGVAGPLAGMANGEFMAGAVAAHAMGQSMAFGISYGTVAAMGAMMTLGGIAQAISPQPKTGDYRQREADPAARAGYLFNSVVNTVEQGGPVPLIYGETLVGSQVIAMGITPEDMTYTDDGNPSKTTFSTLVAPGAAS